MFLYKFGTLSQLSLAQGWKFTENSSKPQGWLLLKVTSPAQNLPALIKMFIVNVMIMNIQ